MTLCDAGPLFALLDPRQVDNHNQCKSALSQLLSPLLTTWPAFTEAMYLVQRAGGWPMQDLLWRLVREGVLTIAELGSSQVQRMEILMGQYRDTPMDLADASLVVIAESLDLTRIFTLDRHFRVYRPKGVGSFDVVP